MRTKGRRKIGVHIDMTPMVDIMMLLVIFFMMSTAFVVVYPGFSVSLPQADANKQPVGHVAVLVTRDGRIAVDGRPVAKAGLTSLLRSLGDAKTIVSVQADKEASHGRVVEVMDEIRKAGITKISIATAAKEP
ncbi:ExbD/TolR family protein [Anaeroselena agilis]|uniref:Biopolymer transporter ExbD n=1 Tax=Anaeroselena agilis TaxID=3063788 RepID=A0ABU3NUD2_9FIRM|nr:biopolymer transporter ExbD [Selenomonadales bacterium 4137-cl]